MPKKLKVWWNFGSLMGLILVLQIVTGLFLAFHYKSSLKLAFLSIEHIIRNVKNGWLVRRFHAKGAAFFFIFIYLHIGRKIYYNLYKNKKVWNLGIIMYILLMAIAFLGYVLPWGQMSYWGATVITNLLSAIPYVGKKFVIWVWGGYSVGGATLSRFYVLHFITPFILAILTVVHIYLLHNTLSQSPLKIRKGLNYVYFHSFFTIKDLAGVRCFLIVLLSLIFFTPLIFREPEKYIKAKRLSTPLHIQPEWYFLFAYTILRSIPKKSLGILGLLRSMLILFIFPLKKNKVVFIPNIFKFFQQIIFWFVIFNFIVLTWLGSQAIENPFIIIIIFISLFYFILFIILFFWKRVSLLLNIV